MNPTRSTIAPVYLRLSLLIFLFLPAVPATAQVTFSNEIQITGFETGINSVYSIDLDGDGDFDILSSSETDDKISWYENLDGFGSFGYKQEISNEADYASDVIGADIDGDGDYDVISASRLDYKIAWYENLDGLGNFGQQHVISSNAAWATSVCSADLDGDGDVDILSSSWTDNKIAWYENLDGWGNFSPEIIITTSCSGANDVICKDLDGDGDLDVLSASDHDPNIAWYENTDGLGTFGAQQTISNYADGAKTVFSTDLDGDGDNDVVSASETIGEISWQENLDGLGSFSVEQVIGTSTWDVRSLYGDDMDGDGDCDLLSAHGSSRVSWFQNTDGLGNFGWQRYLSERSRGVADVITADLDGDGDKEVISAADEYDYIEWFENLDDSDYFGQTNIITVTTVGPRCVYSADLDGDGDNDLLSGSEYDDRIAWYENLDGEGTFGLQRTIAIGAHSGMKITCGDLDGDGDLDVLSTSNSYLYSDRLAWYENLDGLGNFGPQYVIRQGNGSPIPSCADLDGDGDLDVISGSHSGWLTWYENLDGLGDFGLGSPIPPDLDGAQAVCCADMDGDGDIDVVASDGEFWGEIVWYENLEGSGVFGDRQLVSGANDSRTSIFCTDIDNDGDIDVISGTYSGGELYWFENQDGLGSFAAGTHHVSLYASGTTSVFSVDLDNDGDNDFLASSIYMPNITWYENTDGAGTFGPLQVVFNNAIGSESIFSADFDNDGDYDVVSASLNEHKISWFRNELITGVGEEVIASANPKGYRIRSVFPNPFNPVTTIEIELPTVSGLRLSVFDVQGRRVAILNSRRLPAGSHCFSFDGTDSASGVYFIRAFVPGKMNEIRKIILMK